MISGKSGYNSGWTAKQFGSGVVCDKFREFETQGLENMVDDSTDGHLGVDANNIQVGSFCLEN